MLMQPARLRRSQIPTGCPTEAMALLPLHPPVLQRSQRRSVREMAKSATEPRPQIPRPKPQSDAQRRHEARIAGKGPTQAQPARPAITPPRPQVPRRARNQRMWRCPTRQDLPKPNSLCAPRASLSPALPAGIFFIGRALRIASRNRASSSVEISSSPNRLNTSFSRELPKKRFSTLRTSERPASFSWTHGQ